MPASLSTPFDNAHRTMQNDCPELLIPVINDTFDKHYTQEETIVHENDIHFSRQPYATPQKTITDNHFMILGKDTLEQFHLEMQSTEDKTISVRMFDYDTQIAKEHCQLSADFLEITLPYSAVIQLRSNKNTPNYIKTLFKTPQGTITYEIPIIKISNYSINSIFEKKLFFYIPFHIFVYENHFMEYNRDEEKLFYLQKIYEDIRKRLESACIQGVISEYCFGTIIDMSKLVLEHIAANYENIKKGLLNVMGGEIIDYPTKIACRKAWQAGLQEGRQEGFIYLIKDGLLSISEAAKRLEMSEADLQKLL